LGFWGSLFGGSNDILNKDINKTGQIGGFASGLGEGNLAKSSQFYSSILSGDPSQIAKSLGPEIKGIQDRTQQSKNTTAQFGNRSGGNNSSMQMAGDESRSQINQMISSLLGSSASNLGNMGSSLLGTGLSALSTQAGLSQERMQNWSQSILGKGITGSIQAGESFATGGLGGMAAGGSFMQGGAAGLSSGSPFFG
jgi:hypothetical protein